MNYPIRLGTSEHSNGAGFLWFQSGGGVRVVTNQNKAWYRQFTERFQCCHVELLTVVFCIFNYETNSYNRRVHMKTVEFVRTMFHGLIVHIAIYKNQKTSDLTSEYGSVHISSVK